MMFDDFLEVLKDNPFEEIPVDAKTFIEHEDYLGQPGLSKIQYDIVEAMSQIYKKEELIELLGEKEGTEYYNKYTKNEIILQLGKGSGKDFTSTVACCYIVYKLLCLKDPAGRCAEAARGRGAAPQADRGGRRLPREARVRPGLWGAAAQAGDPEVDRGPPVGADPPGGVQPRGRDRGRRLGGRGAAFLPGPGPERPQGLTRR